MPGPHSQRCATARRPRAPDEAPAGDDLRVAVVDGLPLQAQRVPFHTAVPWKGIGGNGKFPKEVTKSGGWLFLGSEGRDALKVSVPTPTPCPLGNGNSPHSELTAATLKRKQVSFPALHSPPRAPDRVATPAPRHRAGGARLEASLTCPQADHNSQVFGVLFHDDSSQDLAAEQGGLETVGERVEAPVAQHGYLVVEGAAGERELWGRGAVSGLRPPRLRVASGQGDHVHTPVNRLSPSRLVSRFRAL